MGSLFLLSKSGVLYKEAIANLLNEKFQEEAFQDCFVVGIDQSGRKLVVFIDADSGMSHGRCREVSRFLEGILDKERWFGENYILEVSSPGIDKPLLFPRQFRKNIGRILRIWMKDGTELEGKIEEAHEISVKISWEVVEPHPRYKKKKVKRKIEESVKYDDMQKAIIQILI